MAAGTANETAAVGRPHVPTRVMNRNEIRDVESFLQHLDTLLGTIPVWIDHAEIIISKAGNDGPEDELGTVVVTSDHEENVTVCFKPYGS